MDVAAVLDPPEFFVKKNIFKKPILINVNLKITLVVQFSF